MVSMLGACAGPRAEKMSFAEVYARPDSQAAPQAPAPAEKKPAKARRGPPEAMTSGELQLALVGFAAKSRDLRASSGTRNDMTEDASRNWNEVLGAVDRFLQREAVDSSPMDVIRARITLEAELEIDLRFYRWLPSDLGTRVAGRIVRLDERMAVLRRLGVRTRTVRARFSWPVTPVAVTSPFGRRVHPLRRVVAEHHGVDFAASIGQNVRAAAAGTVVRAGWSSGYGNRVEVIHADGRMTRYGHLSQILVDPGQPVAQGDSLGLAGDTGSATGPHLHFEVWQDGRPLDPLPDLTLPAEAKTPVAAL
jgi:murein DD-endopeptidase MepM/ murein hydrolase activator NlpD